VITFAELAVAGTAAATAVTVTVAPTGPVRAVTPIASPDAIAFDVPPANVIVPNVCVAVADATETEAETVAVVAAVAYAGTTDKSPNPSEATATAATFFVEIVFTIFLSFSQIKVDLLPGWCEFGTIISNE